MSKDRLKKIRLQKQLKKALKQAKKGLVRYRDSFSKIEGIEND